MYYNSRQEAVSQLISSGYKTKDNINFRNKFTEAIVVFNVNGYYISYLL